jgi:hypothetical protein
MLKPAIGAVLAVCALAVSGVEVRAADLQGSWSGGGYVAFASGGRENVRCRAHYTRRSNEGYVVRATCATTGGRASQTASLRKIGANRYTGTFYNREYGISGTILVNVRGGGHSVRLTSDAGSAALQFSR